VSEVLADVSTPAALRTQLSLAQEMRAFASAELGLPDNRSYTEFVRLDRPFVLWNVFATEPLSVRLKTWCFPVAGCVGYRGYYRREEAEAFAARLRAQGLETHVGGVPAYSTLGWMSDPLLSTFMHYPEAELARLIFHELAHQVAYAPGDTTFNESYATVVEEIGVERWFAHRPHEAALRAFREHSLRRRSFVALLVRHKSMLAGIYGETDEPGATQGLNHGAMTQEAKLRAKQAIFEGLHRDYQALRATWGGYAGFDRWFAQPLTNAHLAAVGAYADLLPAFRLLYAECGQRMPEFHAAVKRLASLPRAERDLRMQRWLQISSGHLYQGGKDGSLLAQELPQGRACGH
jgi:predicted aminopeptidase